MTRSCETCRHSDEAPLNPNNLGAPRQLVCRRNPPGFGAFAVGMQIGTASGFPTVQPKDYCGEHLRKPPTCRHGKPADEWCDECGA